MNFREISDLTRKKIISNFIYCTFLFLWAIDSNGQKSTPELNIPIGHQNKINSVSFSSDGRFIATGSGDNTFIIWDAKTNMEIRKVNTGAPVQQILFPPDASYLITITGQNEAKYVSAEKLVFKKWDIQTGRMIEQLKFTGSPDIAFLASGNLLVPDYSEDLNKKDQSMMDRFDMSNMDKLINSYTNINYDSLEKDAEKRVGELTKDINKIDFTDKKAVEEYTKKIMSQYMEGASVSSMNPASSSFSLLDAKTFKPVGKLTNKFEKFRLLHYLNEDYLVSADNSYTDKDYVEVWNIKNMQQAGKASSWKKFSVSNSPLHFSVSSDKGFFAGDFSGSDIQLWQIEKNNPIATIKTKGEFINGIEFSTDGSMLYVYSSHANSSVYSRYIEGWSTNEPFQQVVSIKLPVYYYGEKIYIAPDNNYFAVESGWSLVKVNRHGDSIGAYSGHSASPAYYGFTDDDKQVYINYGGNFASWDMQAWYKTSAASIVDEEAKAQKKTLSKTERDRLIQERIKMFPVQDLDIYKGYYLDWDIVRGGATYRKGDKKPSRIDTVSKNNNYILSNEYFKSGGKEAMDWAIKMSSLTPKDDLTEDQKKMFEMANSQNGIYSIASAEKFYSPVTLLINRKTNDTISLIKIDSLDWIMVLKNGYYMTSRNGAKVLSYVMGIKVFPFEQFDLKYNRPDKVLKAIGLADPTLIDAYKKAYLKRISRLGIDTTLFRNDFNVPVADFKNRNEIAYDQKTGKLKLDVIASDPSSKLDRFNIWINGVPLYGKKGQSIKANQSDKLSKTVEVELSRGKNQVEVSVMNVNGVESFREPLFVNYTPSVPIKETLYFIGIGIDQFSDNRFNLQYSTKDIRDLAIQLKKKYGGNIVIDTLFNENVTIEKVKQLKENLNHTNVDDKVIVSYSGHGLLTKDFDYYLSTYSVNFEKPEQSGLAYDELENLLDGIPARKKLMLIDACHSGEVDKDELERLNKTSDSLKLIKGLKPVSFKKDEKHLGLKNSFELMQSLFVNVGRSTGATVISAAAGTQFALERNDLKNGVFTYSILESMNRSQSMTVTGLQKVVSQRVQELTKGMQQPTSRNENVTFDWKLW